MPSSPCTSESWKKKANAELREKGSPMQRRLPGLPPPEPPSQPSPESRESPVTASEDVGSGDRSRRNDPPAGGAGSSGARARSYRRYLRGDICEAISARRYLRNQGRPPCPEVESS